MAPDLSFTEGSLADSLQMSKTPVREALGVLALEHYVTVMPHSGYRVTSFTLRDINELFETHIPLANAASVTTRFSEEEGAALSAALASRSAGTDAGVPEPFVGEYVDFQLTLTELSGNRRLRPLLARLLHQHERMIRLCVQKGAAPGPLVGDDRPQLDALLRQEWDAAGAAAAERLSGCRDRVLRTLVSVDDILDAAIRS